MIGQRKSQRLQQPAGNLRDRFAFDGPVYDARGVQVGMQPDLLICNGNVRYLRGGESVQAARLDGKQPVVVTIRRSSVADSITTDWVMRDVRGGTRYNVRAVVPTVDRQWLEITAESGVAT
ncbi:head-tail adaptor protein [Salipiger manganoxidans]|uniref:phage head completion protein n=1 Tax=Salipiger marinus TaxID=555512 RepID=UPI001E4E82CD|nr:head-tail adaptor protein [Salipiger manganoxidans]MCD1620744.1 head-tail adaptor protein [Salipiger manganoxidans]